MCAWLIAVVCAVRVHIQAGKRAVCTTGFLVFLFIPATARAQPAKSDAQVFVEADAAFEQGMQTRSLLLQSRRHFSLAADRYLDLHRRGVRSPALYLSLGNAATLADRWPEALWAYHMGLKLDPNHPALREHLAFVRGKVIYPPAGQGRLDADTWPPWLHRPTLYEFVCISMFAYVLACFLGTIVFFRHTRALTLIAIASLVIAGVAGVGVWREWRLAEIERDTPHVIVAENTPLYRGNAASYPHHPALAMLPRGMEVRQIHRRGQWLQIRLTTGEVGWLPVSSVLIVEP